MSGQEPAVGSFDDIDRLIRVVSKFLLRNSSEGTFDLHVTLREIGAAFEVRIESMVMMEGLLVVITHPDGGQWSGVVHAQPSLERLDLVSNFKQLDRRIIAGELSAVEATRLLEELESSPPAFPWWLRFIGVMLFAAGFAPSMQANWRQLGGSLFLGAVMAVVYLIGERVAMLRVMLPLVAATAVSLVAFTVLHIAHAHGGPVLVMVPALFVMIPGDFLCAAAAEVAVGQFTVGTIRLVQSFLVLFELAAGVIIGAAISGAGTSALISSTTVDNMPWIITALAWIPFTVGMGLTFCARVRDVGWLLLGVYLAWGTQLLGTWFFGSTAGTFLAALLLTLVGVLLGRNPNRPPTLVIILGGVFVLTVGSMALRGITTLAGGHLLESFHDLANFTEIAGALTFGLICGTSIGVAILRRTTTRFAVSVS
ncbi:MAG: threonine/serine exporter family protein [Acidimicrobiales bacterium]